MFSVYFYILIWVLGKFSGNNIYIYIYVVKKYQTNSEVLSATFPTYRKGSKMIPNTHSLFLCISWPWSFFPSSWIWILTLIRTIQYIQPKCFRMIFHIIYIYIWYLFCSWNIRCKIRIDFRGSKCDTPHLSGKVSCIYIYINMYIYVKHFHKIILRLHIYIYIYIVPRMIYTYSDSMEYTLTGTDVQMLPRNNAAWTESSIASFLRVAIVWQYENICIYIFIYLFIYLFRWWNAVVTSKNISVPVGCI